MTRVNPNVDQCFVFRSSVSWSVEYISVLAVTPSKFRAKFPTINLAREDGQAGENFVFYARSVRLLTGSSGARTRRLFLPQQL